MDRRAGRRRRRLIPAAALAVAVVVGACAAGDDRGQAAGSADPARAVTPAQGAEGAPAVDIAHQPGGDGHWVLFDDGRVVAHGSAPALGAVDVATGRAVALTPTSSGRGYWVFTDAGAVLARGDATSLGDVADLALAGTVDDAKTVPGGDGYYQVGADGGVFAHGTAPFRGSVPGVLPAGAGLTAPVVGIAPTATGAGYHLVGADGGVFTFGDAAFHGSVPGALGPDRALAAPIVDLVPAGGGYLLLGADGGVFAFGSATFHGSMAADGATDVVAVSALPDGTGYLVLRADGTVTPFGSATDPGPEPDPSPGPRRLRAEVLARYPHDTGSFTQGLEVVDGRLIESAGMYGESDLRVVELSSGTPTTVVPVDLDAFAEGVTEVDGTLVQLTWRERVAYRYDADTLEPLGTFAYDGEGWGICDGGDRLVMSDGSAALTFRDRSDFTVLGSVAVTLDGAPVERLNELECVGDDVYANVWHRDDIVRIDPTTGAVEAVIDASALAAEAGADGEAVLNGIAHLDRDRFLVTGKYWPTLYEVRFVPA